MGLSGKNLHTDNTDLPTSRQVNTDFSAPQKSRILIYQNNLCSSIQLAYRQAGLCYPCAKCIFNLIGIILNRLNNYYKSYFMPVAKI